MIDENNMNERMARIEKFITSQALFQKEFLTVPEAAQFLSLRINTVYKLTSAEAIPYYCPNGKRVYFKRNELVNWVFESKKVSQRKLNTKAKLAEEQIAI